jgi:hypothetical protein
MAGAAPEKPPKSILVWLVLFSHLLYTIMLSNRPKHISAKTHTLMSHANSKEIAARINPNTKAF